jgi:transcriptional regulator with XRE-family HTH domain
MSSRLNSYLRTHRRRHGITLDELALLIGHKRSGPIGNVERDLRNPSVSMLIALAYIFATPADELFPRLHDEIRFGVLKRAEALYEALQGQPGPVAHAKLDLLERIIRPVDGLEV